MAIDQWLLQSAKGPLLRIYEWDGAWGSLGYFSKLADAEAAIPDLNWVRRASGGGIVDHRYDWTYSLMIPKCSAAANSRGPVLYKAIHEALQIVLNREGFLSFLTEEPAAANPVCFQAPAQFDLVDRWGTKLAGAAQRSSKDGVLHQGSTIAAENSELRSGRLAATLAERFFPVAINPPQAEITAICEARFGRCSWLNRR